MFPPLPEKLEPVIGKWLQDTDEISRSPDGEQPILLAKPIKI
jgi:hypothetical protein